MSATLADTSVSVAPVSLAPPPIAPCFPIAPPGWRLNVADTPVARQAAAEFTSGFEEGTLQFFDAVLPECDRMVDFGGFIGFTSLYAAAQGPSVDVFEPSPVNGALLEANLQANPRLAHRIRLHRHAVGAKDGNLFETVQRGSLLRGRAEAVVPVRNAVAVLEELGLSPDMLLKIDIEGAEYEVVPAIADLLRRERPFLHISFHPFNIVRGTDEYLNQVARLRGALAIAEAVAPYRHMYFHTPQGWTRIDKSDRMALLSQYLLKPKPKPVPRIATPQYGFTDALALSEVALPLG
ncbi:MAG: FkbM family methyltransferase [Alphaproteobacteria bacterium]|nr:FkbM family methyltransferase [Alphaproteobacteria bacterium]